MKNYLHQYLLICIGSFFIIAALQLAACDKDSTVQLRIENKSSHNFDSVELQWGQNYTYTDVAAGQKSEYQEVEGAYRYAYVKVLIGSDRFVIQPIDYVGENKLDPGNYTYILKVEDYDQRSLSLELQKD